MKVSGIPNEPDYLKPEHQNCILFSMMATKVSMQEQT